jgi:hypothetical protein
MDLTLKYLGHDVPVTVTSWVEGTSGFISGLPENCYQEHPPEVEFYINSGHEGINAILESNDALMANLTDSLIKQLT